jgi:CheY-like chemotaxis protein
VVTCASASEANEILKTWTPDLVVSDIAMPDRDGYWLLKRIRSMPQHASLPVIALTAYATAADRANVLAAGFNMFVAKPIEPAELLSTAYTLLQHRFPETGSIRNAVPALEQNSELAGKKILLIEDDLLSSEALRFAIEQEGSEFRAASKASEALLALENWTPDLIISDIGLPDEDGYSLIRKIRSFPALLNLPAIALTGYGKEEGENALTAGFQFYRSKPLEPNALISLLKEIIKNHPKDAASRNIQ